MHLLIMPDSGESVTSHVQFGRRPSYIALLLMTIYFTVAESGSVFGSSFGTPCAVPIHQSALSVPRDEIV